MSKDNSFPDIELPVEVRDYINRLKSLTESQERELKLIRDRNERLEKRLKNVQAYNEELREQIKKISGKVCQRIPASDDNTGERTSKHFVDKNVTKHDAKVSAKDDEKSGKSENPDWLVSHDADGDVNHVAIVDQLREAASEVARDQFLKGMAYEESSGLYYDFKSGYYFDAQRSLYYDGNSGTYYSYNYETSTYEVHSQVAPATREQRSRRKAKKQSREDGKTEDKANRKRSHSGSLQDSSEKNSGSAPNSPLEVSEEQKLETKDSEPEDGEISSSEESLSESEDDQDETQTEFVSATTTAVTSLPTPCIRIVIVETSEDMPVGKLFIVTCTGGSIGREGDHNVLLCEDMGCSKIHARISHKENRYYVTDLGSSNGTYINGQRLSKSKEESEPREIGHGTVIQIGTTKLLCHVHPGRETCFECEPGIVQVKESSKVIGSSYLSKEKTRKKEMKELRKKYGLSSSGTSQERPSSDKTYSDRASERRRQVGSDNPYEKTESAHVDKSLDSKNKGFKMLQKMGWAEGKGLGKESEGRVEPVSVSAKNNRSGLGDSNPNVTLDFKTKQKADLWKKTQVRFDKVKALPIFEPEVEEEEKAE